MRFVLLAALALSPLVGSPAAQDLIYRGYHTGGTTGTGVVTVESAAAVGDVDGDGYSEVALIDDAGQLQVVSGKDGAWIVSEANGAPGGFVLGLGDLDGDGHDEFLAGLAPGVRLRRGAPDGPELGWSRNEPTLAAVALDDLNGDGVREVALGTGTSVVLVDGATGALVRTIALGQDAFGAALLSIDDQNGDLVDDLLIGEPGRQAGAGAVHVASVADGAPLAIYPGGAEERAGAALALLGDLNNDGNLEIATGSPGFDAGGTARGRVQVHSLGLPPVFQYEVLGTVDGLEFGGALVAVADADGDGGLDLGVFTTGAPVVDRTLHLLAGADGAALWTHAITDVPTLTSNAPPLSSGDVDGDGRGDLVLIESFGCSVYAGPRAPGWFARNWSSIFVSRGPRSVDFVGDLDGDGRSEYLVGRTTSLGGAADLYDSAGGLLHSFPAPDTSTYGEFVRGLGDLDGDGTPDFAIGSPRGDAGGYLRGRVELISGANLSLIREHVGASDTDALGGAISPTGDLDQDGVPDYLIGLQGYSLPGKDNCGAAELYSGQTGALLQRIEGASTGDRLGASLDLLGDLDQDGVEDFVVGVPGWSTPGFPTPNRVGQARVISGATFATLFSVEGIIAQDFLGESVVGLGDADGDGVPDVLVGNRSTNNFGTGTFPQYTGVAVLLSGATGVAFRGHYSFLAEGTGAFGHSIAAAGDFDEDGHADYLISDPHTGLGTVGAGVVRVYSGRTGEVLHTLRGRTTRSGFGHRVAGGGDVNGDGKDDWLVIERFPPTIPGVVHVRTSEPLDLVATHNLGSAEDGSTVPLLGLAKPALVGDTYWILASTSGASPGFNAFGAFVPLNPDWLLTRSIVAPNDPSMWNTLGVIGADGASRSTITIPPNPSLYALSLHFVRVVLTGPPLSIVEVSNPVNFSLDY